MLLIVVVLAGLGLTSLVKPAGAAATLDVEEQTFVTLINNYRAHNGPEATYRWYWVNNFGTVLDQGISTGSSTTSTTSTTAPTTPPATVIKNPRFDTEIHDRLIDAFVERVVDEAVRARRIAERPTRRSQIRGLGLNSFDASAVTGAVHERRIQRPTNCCCIQLSTNALVDVESVLVELAEGMIG